MITLYKNKNTLSHSFPAKELDKIKEICYSLGIKWYTISYTQKEYEEYEQFSKGNN